MTTRATIPTPNFTMQDATSDMPYVVTVQLVEDFETCVACDKDLDGRLAIVIHDDEDAAMDDMMCLGCFDDSVDSCATYVIKKN